MTGALYRLDRQEAALIQWWRRRAEGRESSTFLAHRLLEIATNPTADAIGEIPRLACLVDRMEVALNEVMECAREDDYRARTVAELARLTEPQS